MRVRDATETDSGRLADLADVPSEVMADAIHDRTVCVAEDDGDVVGFVGFDAHRDAVHVTHLHGSPTARELLLDEPIRFAASESMPIELVALETEDRTHAAAESAGFERIGSGPRFEGRPTTRFRLENPESKFDG